MQNHPHRHKSLVEDDAITPVWSPPFNDSVGDSGVAVTSPGMGTDGQTRGQTAYCRPVVGSVIMRTGAPAWPLVRGDRGAGLWLT